MRTKEQIDALRHVLRLQFGPIMNFASDRWVNLVADSIQRDIWLKDPTKYNWTIQVKLNGQEDLEWTQIEPENSKAFGSFAQIYNKAIQLMTKYQDLYSMRFSRFEDEIEFVQELTSAQVHRTAELLDQTARIYGDVLKKVKHETD